MTNATNPDLGSVVASEFPREKAMGLRHAPISVPWSKLLSSYHNPPPSFVIHTPSFTVHTASYAVGTPPYAIHGPSYAAGTPSYAAHTHSHAAASRPMRHTHFTTHSPHPALTLPGCRPIPFSPLPGQLEVPQWTSRTTVSSPSTTP